jgi:Smg protein
MFDILVYLYETYYRPDACPEPVALAKKLSDVGFEEEDICDALDWLSDLRSMTQTGYSMVTEPDYVSTGMRFYVAEELNELGMAAIGFIQFLESAKVINSLQREIIIERALAVNEAPVSLGKLKIIVLMILWSQGKEPDALMFDDLFSTDDEATTPRLLH